MAGEGSRFKDAGYKTPKPLINVLGKPMFVWALSSLPLELADLLVFLCLQEHLDNWPLERQIKGRYDKSLIIPVSQVTEGQACTVLLAREYINNEDGLIIHNADTYFQSSLEETLESLEPSVRGVISAFRASEDKWSFAKVGDDGYVVEVAEKQPISQWATTGMYYFRHGSDFVSGADKMIQRDLRVKNEFYVSPVYNILIAEGKKFILDIADTVWCMGTPIDLKKFLRESPG
jgi:dTDP-glucose pyrophosphorylase